MPRWLDRALGLGPSDEPRPISVARKGRSRALDLTPTPGARVRIGRAGTPDEQRALLFCARENIPFDRVDGEGVWMDEVPVTARALLPA